MKLTKAEGHIMFNGRVQVVYFAMVYKHGSKTVSTKCGQDLSTDNNVRGKILALNWRK